MNEQVVAVSVDKIQTFLTEVIHSHVQEKQTEEATLRGIISSSNQISRDFYKSIQDIFPEPDQEVLLQCSGVFIFRCVLLRAELKKRLNTLFVDYYRESQGQKLLRWVAFPADGLGNIEAIQEAKKRLKQTKYWNHIIENNQDLLFSFCQVQMDKENKGNIDREQADYPAFARDINALNQNGSEAPEDKKRFRIAVLKADLDGMGAMFKRIQSFEDYRHISQVLNEEISLDGLHQAAVMSAPGGKTGWLFPLYIAGDDIFFAVAMEDLIYGINVCRQLMYTVNHRIEKYGIPTKLAMSIGVEISFNRQPIRYYMEMVEEQLKNAKSEPVPDQLKAFFVLKISIGNMTFFDIDYGQMKEQKKSLLCEFGKRRPGCKCENCRKKSEINQQLQNVPIWDYFMNDLKLLNFIRNNTSGCSELLGKASFFYTLLEDITDQDVRSDNVKYINHILYHLLPSHFEDSAETVREMEIILNSKLIKQLCRKEEKGIKIVLEERTKCRFESYLRLMILFCDARFHIFSNDGADVNQKWYIQNKEEIYRYLIRQPREHLFEICLKNIDSKLAGIFVDKVIDTQNVKNKFVRKEGYQRLNLDKSMFLRLREVERIPIEKAAEMIEIRNPSTEDEKTKLQAFNEERKKEGKLPNRLFFDKKYFCKIARRTGKWTPDFIDSLMLFYEYNELVMKFKNPDFK
ncbi:hypothetical protein LI031_30015 [Enterocloster citroniae]|uniref:Cas10/Cmr2 second palm domain-containing protein n=1 Tax=Enterocloster citroniae TaxID=358743 RepID=UPI001D083D40|nr:hypothetical protein [Enterocloster citroniae]MCB7068085.1 hypothetical protein [Enterocloster citroniae]